MSTTTYKAVNRGQLVTVPAGDSARVYNKAVASGKTDEFIDGPATAGTATGYIIVDGAQSFTEVLRAVILPGISAIVKIYLLTEDVSLSENPSYDPAADLDRPADTQEQTTTTPTKTGTYDNGETGPVIVTKTPTATPTADTDADETPTTDTTKKWVTYGLYAVLGIAAITLTIILVMSVKKVKPSLA